MNSATGMAVNDTILWVEDTGEAELPPILCLHSLWLDGTMFDGLVKAAAGRFRVVRPDFRGQGGSAPATGDIVSMECCANDMVALIEAMELSGVNLLAASMGGDVAVRVAADRPDLIRSLVLLGSSVRAEPPAQRARFKDWLDSAAVNGFVGDDLDMLMSIMFGESTRARSSARPMLEHWRSKLRLTPRSAWPALLGVLDRNSAVDCLARVKAPTLIVNGTEDIARPPPWADEVAAGIEGAKLVMLDGVGHSPILEAPDTVIPEVLQFIADRGNRHE